MKYRSTINGRQITAEATTDLRIKFLTEDDGVKLQLLPDPINKEHARERVQHFMNLLGFEETRNLTETVNNCTGRLYYTKQNDVCNFSVKLYVVAGTLQRIDDLIHDSVLSDIGARRSRAGISWIHTYPGTLDELVKKVADLLNLNLLEPTCL